MEVTIFGIKLVLNPVAFSIGSWNVYWYGIIIGLGFLLAVLYAMRRAEHFGIDKDRMLDVVLVTTPLAILCARAYFCIFPYENGDRITSVKEFFGIGSGEGFRGLAIYGGVIGAFAVGYLMCRLRKVNVLDMFDLAALGFLIGQSIGRWGNFFNQEAFGKPTFSTWFGMMSRNTHNVMVHPCFLYESIWCLIGFLILHRLSKNRAFKGQIILGYGVWYGFGRFFIESLRTDSLMIGRLKVSMLLSAVLFISCLISYISLRVKSAKIEHRKSYVSLFKEQMSDDEDEESLAQSDTTDESDATKTTEDDRENGVPAQGVNDGSISAECLEEPDDGSNH